MCGIIDLEVEPLVVASSVDVRVQNQVILKLPYLRQHTTSILHTWTNGYGLRYKRIHIIMTNFPVLVKFCAVYGMYVPV